MRFIDTIVIHESATKPNMDIGVKEIRQWHLARGFKDIGYHYVIRRDGTVEIGRNLAEAGAHAIGHNNNSIGICLVGGLRHDLTPDFNFTKEQINALVTLVNDLKRNISNKVEVVGHRDLSGANTVCPGFDVYSFFGEDNAD